MRSDSIARVHYFKRQFLRTVDFTDEQAYHLAMRRRHNIAHHTWGVVRGLELAADEAGNLVVKPGMAVDGYGRELIVPETLPLPVSAFVEKGSDDLDVWLEYDRIGADPAPPGYSGCGEQADASPYRWQERPLIRLTVPDPALTEPRQPESVPQGDWDFDPSRLPPDDPQQDWPVFLGRIERSRQAPDKPYVYSVDLGERPYIGLVGEAITAPSGRAKVQIGSGSKKAKSGDEPVADENRFAVFIPESDAGSKDLPSLAVDKDGEVNVRGETNLHGDLTIKGGAVEFSAGSVADRPPWGIYRYGNPDGSGAQEMHIVMAGGSEGCNKVVVGAWSEEKKAFQRCLTIDDNCQVTVHGDLFVSGAINGGVARTKKRVARKFSKEAERMVAAGVHSGIAGVGAPFTSMGLKAMAWDAGVHAWAPLLLSSKAGVEAIADSFALLGKQADGVKAFVERLKANHPELAEVMKKNL